MVANERLIRYFDEKEILNVLKEPLRYKRLLKFFSEEDFLDIRNYKRRVTICYNEELKRLLSKPGQTVSEQLLYFA